MAQHMLRLARDLLSAKLLVRIELDPFTLVNGR